MQINIIKQLLPLYHQLSNERKRYFWYFTSLSVLNAVAELVSIGAIIPFLIAISSPSELLQNETLRPIWATLKITEYDIIVYITAGTFLSLIVFSSIVKILLLKTQAAFSHGAGHELSKLLYETTLFQPYSIHKKRNPSFVVSAVATKASNIVNGVVMPITTIISSLITILLSISLLILVASKLFIISILVVVLFYYLFNQISKSKLSRLSRTINQETDNSYKAIQEGLGGIKDILLSGYQEFYLERFAAADKKKRLAEASGFLVGSTPRIYVEAISIFILIFLILTFVHQGKNITNLIPVFGAVVLGAQKFLPVANKIYASVAQLQVGRSYVESAVEILNTPKLYVSGAPIETLKFNEKLILKDINFQYDDAPEAILKGLNLYIPRGATVGLIGETGSGKSLILDIIMGLVPPSSGKIIIDNFVVDGEDIQRWQSLVTHVPQDVYLADVSVAENIALGQTSERIDFEKVEAAAKKAKIHDYIQQLELKYETQCGERGVRLSGGQKQRIAIARALYKEAELIIFDEATSALDNVTEKQVMDSINEIKGQKTILMVAHRVSTLSECDMIYELKDGHLIEIKNGISNLKSI